MDDKVLWNIINSHFQQNPQYLVSHHIESYNDFFNKDIFEIFKNQNPILITTDYDESIEDYRHKCRLYMGGKEGRRIYFGKPIIYDKDNVHYMYPNEARLRNMTYAMTIHFDVEVEFEDVLRPGEEPYVIGPEYIDKDVLQKAGAENLDDDCDEDCDDEDDGDNGDDFNYKMTGGLELDEQPSVHDPAQQKGGMEKKTRKIIIRQKTPALAAILREANEKSMVAPNIQKRSIVLEKVYLGKFPIMVQSDYCILKGMTKELRYAMGECKSDPGGYFIIDGKEKTIIVQEKFADNALYIQKGKVEDETAEDSPVVDKYAYSIVIKSVSENVSKPRRSMAVRLKAPGARWSNGNIVVDIPNVRSPVPLFIVFRALGVISDKDIITMCLLDMDKYEFMQDLFIPSVHDAGGILDQTMALQFIADLTKFHVSTSHALEILSDYFLPHVGETNFMEKAYFLGYMVFRLLLAHLGLEQPTDRDNLRYKRIELVGSLIRDLFNEYYKIQQREIFVEFDSLILYNRESYEHNLFSLIDSNYRKVFGNRSLDAGIKKAFKGSWGAHTHTKRVGIVQDLNRLSFNSAISHLRKTNLPIDSSLKIVGPRVLHGSHWGYIDPIDTPDGGNIGLHKTLAIASYITRGYSRKEMVEWMRIKMDMKYIDECTPLVLSTMTKVFINGAWAGSIENPLECVSKMRLFRRNGLIPLHTSISFDIAKSMVCIFTDAGRICRPIFYKDDITGKLSFENSKELMRMISQGEFTWFDLITGINEKKDASYHPNDTQIRELADLYTGVETEKNPAKLERFIKDKAVIEYIDSSESEQSLIAMDVTEWTNNADKHERYTHLEIHNSLTFGIMCNQIIFPENNPVTRNSFSCSQSRQACSMYHTNHQLRMDKTAVVLNNGQIPLIKSRYFEHINGEMNPYGENAIVAIMCYTGYNVEDAILINEGALKRGLFRTTYYTSYQSHEERKQMGDQLVDKRFSNIESEVAVIGLKPGHDYSKLDDAGLIRVGTAVDDKTIIIGLTSNNSLKPGVRIDNSVTTKKGQLGIVDKTFITEGEEGERIAKVRIREERIPNLGDKMASRAGQKGTIGLVVPEKDMPFTKDGIRPDLIINPHAKPTRQTIGQLVECLIGKACVMYGGFGDCTAFNNEGSKIGIFGELLTKLEYHSSGNEIMYNGMTGEQIETEIFIGPTYYMRLKHMVKDKINYRAQGPRTQLTRQPVAGRANDGGLRIGEMERDVLIAHGLTNFLNESMLDRGDHFYLAICNTTGLISVYNPAKNLFMSPMADGPLKYNLSVDGQDLSLEKVTRHGRSFSILKVPYSFKLFLQELETINVSMRIITDDNIDQIANMAFSTNMEKLTQDITMNPAKLIQNIKATLTDRKPGQKTPEIIDESLDFIPESPSEGPPSAYVPPEDSPGYMPVTPEEGMQGPSTSTPDSVPYAPPLSPDYAPPISPDYAPPISPDYAPPINQKGGQVDAFELNEPVFYMKSMDLGYPSDHPWKVVRKGGSFLTIRNDANDNPLHSIQIVDPMEIMKINDETISRVKQAVNPMSSASIPAQNMTTNPNQQPNINFNLKIVNGDNNSDIPINDSTPDATNTSNTKAYISTPESRVSMKGEDTGIKIKGGNDAPEEKTILGGLADFSNLVIRKIM